MKVNVKDERLKNYIGKIYSNLGIYEKKTVGDLTVTDQWELVSEEKLLSATMYSNGKVTIYRNKNDEEYAAIEFIFHVDDYWHTFWKSKHPLSQKDVALLRLLKKIAFKFLFEEPIFDCWECGAKGVHLLEIEGSLEEKLDKFESECCCE